MKSLRFRIAGPHVLPSVLALAVVGCSSLSGEEPAGTTAQASIGCQGLHCTAVSEHWSDAPIGTRLLVIGPDVLRTPLQNLVAHKNAHAMPAFFMSIESARATLWGIDDAATVKRVIQTLIEQRGIQYVLIAGDASLMPARHSTLHTAPGYPQSTTVQYQSTDNYYANVYHHTGSNIGAPSNWDANGNGQYDEGNADVCNFACSNGPDDVDAYPDVAVGRVPAHDVTEMTRYVTKVIRYETGQMVHPMNNYVAFADGNYLDGSNTPIAPSMIKTFQDGAGLTHATGVTVVDYGVGFAAGKLDASFISVDVSAVNAMAPNATWLTYLGHGAPSGWGIGHDAGQISSLANDYALPVVWANACGTGRFKVNTYGFGDTYVDKNGIVHSYSVTEPDPTKGIAGSAWDFDANVGYPFTPAEPSIYSDSSARDLTIATSWLVKSTAGAIAYFGESLSRPDGMGAELEGLVVSSLRSSPSHVLGDAWLAGQRSYWTNHIASTDIFWTPRDFLMDMTMFGDPSLRITTPQFDATKRTASPGAFYGSHGTLSGDLNGDGFGDLIGFGDGYIGVLLGKSDGTFGTYQTWLNGSFYGSHGTFVGDVNGDKKADIVGVGDGYVGVMLSTGTGFGGYQTWTTSTSAASTHGNLLGDVDGDGRADLVSLRDDYLVVLRSTGSSFGSGLAWAGGPFYGSHGTFLADIDGDKRADLVGLGDGYVGVLRSNGTSFNGYETWWGGSFYGANNHSFLADVDGDGRADLVGLGTDQIGVIRSNGQAFGKYENWWTGNFNSSHGNVLGDINGDHRADLVGFEDGDVAILRSYGY